MTRAVKRQLLLCLALISAPTFSQGQPPATPPIVSFAVSTGGVDEVRLCPVLFSAVGIVSVRKATSMPFVLLQILWPALDVVSAFAVQSCPDATCATPSVVPGTPTSLCASCQEFVLSYTPPGRRFIVPSGLHHALQVSCSAALFCVSPGGCMGSAATIVCNGRPLRVDQSSPRRPLQLRTAQALPPGHVSLCAEYPQTHADCS